MPRSPLLPCVCFLLCFLTSPTSAQADVVSLDAAISGNVISNNTSSFQQGADVAIKHDPTGNFTRVGYIKFDLSSISDPIIDASLEFTSSGQIAGSVSNNSFVYDFDIFALNDGDSNEGWTVPMGFSDGIGLNTTTHEEETAETTSVATFQQTGRGTVGETFDLNTSGILSEVVGDSDDQITFIIFRQQNAANGNIVHGFERSSFKLNLTTAVPEPGGALILLIATASISFRRKRQTN